MSTRLYLNLIARLKVLLEYLRRFSVLCLPAIRRLVSFLRFMTFRQYKRQESSARSPDTTMGPDQVGSLSTSGGHTVVLTSALPPTEHPLDAIVIPTQPSQDSRSLPLGGAENNAGYANQETPPEVQRARPILQPIEPNDILRYDKKNKDVPEGWEVCVHPEGALYFRHAAKGVFTEADLRVPRVRDFITDAVEDMEERLAKANFERNPSTMELVLECSDDTWDDGSGDRVCGYYFADTQAKTLFWLDDYDATSLVSEMDALVTEEHMQCELEARFWYHCELFPNHRPYSEVWVQELMGMLLHASIDSMTATDSTSPYKWQEMQNIAACPESQGYVACAVCRLMGTFVHTRFLHLWGTKNARLTRNESVYEDHGDTSSALFRTFSWFFFYASEKYVDALKDLSVDGIINLRLWTDFIERLQVEWSELSLIATVMLTVDVSFLTIQSVDIPSRTPGLTGAAQVAIYLSTVASVGSIIIGLLLNRQHRAISRNDAMVAHQYLGDKYGSAYGFESLAILYTVPYALLMWAALGVVLPSAIAWGFVLGLILVYLHTNWEGTGHRLRLAVADAWSRVKEGL
ncbi:hypothetical protein OE88DRAFT_1364550 [Heliocybe sulcata]|uniref:WW domain-containing protein n=1 Tax=Heliocybe sulcata TaxID=5364 RepID=A0A5C3N436_9AGAM|nr:hypothetical protein OE88DRAFT_1364550 [Heliocybe sulcata]